MRIALIGYGKMGKEIEQVALQRKHQVVLRIEKNNLSQFTVANLKMAEVAIEFSTPVSVVQNIKRCFDASVPIVVGTTGWYDKVEDVKNVCTERNGALLYASNFSIGVNLFFELNCILAELMNKQTDYDVTLKEIHHTQKLDKPSGTAITLANGILNENSGKKNWTADINEKDKKNKLFIDSIRSGDVVGTHEVCYKSSIDKIEIKHEAYSRKGFALGAVLASEWLLGKKGFFTMKDFLNGIK